MIQGAAMTPTPMEAGKIKTLSLMLHCNIQGSYQIIPFQYLSKRPNPWNPVPFPDILCRINQLTGDSAPSRSLPRPCLPAPDMYRQFPPKGDSDLPKPA